MKLPKRAQLQDFLKPGNVKSSDKGVQVTCPRCKSARLQRGYKDTSILFRLVRRYELLCNNCGLEFKDFDFLHSLTRKPSTNKQSPANRRQAPRYRAHIPVTISLAQRDPGSDKLTFSKASRGHCEVISKAGVALSFVGSRFGQREFMHTGRLLFVSIILPNGPVDALITTVMHNRVERDEGTPSWYVSATITQMTESDGARLATYLDERAKREPVFLQE